MAYQIKYPSKRKYPGRNRFRNFSWKRWAAIGVAVAVLVGTLWFLGDNGYLFSGNREVTGRALDNMIQQVGEGQSIGQAFAAFCREIILDGKTAV